MTVEQERELGERMKAKRPDLFTLPIGSFNLKENIFRYFTEEELKDKKVPEISEYEVYIWRKPKTGCHYCFGRGNIGVDVLTNFKVPCRCIKAQYRKIGLRQTPKATEPILETEPKVETPIYES